MLELQAVSYRYPGFARRALLEIDLTIGEGEVVGLVGANEAGKSTLCLVASGLAPGSIGGSLGGGRLLVDGELVTGRPVHELAGRLTIGFQDPATQLSGITGSVIEEVALGPLHLGLPAAETLGRAREALARLGIGGLAERRPDELSGGQAQLVVLASLLAMGPRHLILDEPTAQLDPAATRLVADAIASLAGGGTSLLIAEHRTDLLARVCSRIVALDRGRIVADGPATDLLADPRLEEWGVAAPAAVRLARELAAAGLDPALVEPPA